MSESLDYTAKQLVQNADLFNNETSDRIYE